VQPINQKKRDALTHDRLTTILRFDEVTGRLFWRGGVKRGVWEGMPAGVYSHKYPRIKIDEFTYKIAHVIWFYKTGRWPPIFLDHRDLNTKNNDPDNLREANHSQNNANRRCRPNSTGFKGVIREGRRFGAYISINGKNKSLGRFDTPEAAHAAYCAAATERFGEFARFA
jgi:hypothetical protein